MFKDKYIKDNESIAPDESVKRYIKSKLTKESKSTHRVNKNALIATVLSLCLAIGVVFVANNTANKPAVTAESVLNEQVTYGDIYDSINTLLKENRPSLYTYFSSGIAGLLNGSAKDGAAGTTSEIAIDIDTSQSLDDNLSSSTNNQVQGVDEADIVKNDGRYIYILRDGNLIIIDSSSSKPKVIAEKDVTHSNETVQSMFVNGDKLAVILSCYYQKDEFIRMRVFGIEDKAAPREISTIEQSGLYSDARMIENTVYLLSNYMVTNEKIDKDKPEEYVPCIDEKAISEDSISMIEGFEEPTYLVISAVDIESGTATASEAVLGGAENIYADADSLYYTFTNHRVKDKEKSKYKNTTTIVKLSLEPEDISTVATGTVDGKPLNQFSMDEYEGNLRIVTTVTKGEEKEIEAVIGVQSTSGTNKTEDVSSTYMTWTSTTYNSLYVLDNELKIIGSIEDLAKDERVYSVRFDGSIGYFVTFRQTDPLFTVDLSNPKKPKVLSELKIPGFSEYLHPFGQDLLFGFGKSATEQGSVTGLKISMFDVSDPANVTENHVTPIASSWSEASSNHKAIMVDYAKNIIAFVAADDYGVSCMYVYGYDVDNGFFLKNETVLENKYSYDARFVWIGEYFYLVTQNEITAFSMADFTKTAFLQF